MTHTELNLFGQEEAIVQNDVDEVRELIRKYPAFSGESGAFLFVAAKERLLWVSALDEQRQRELRDFLSSAVSLVRRKQEILAEDKRKC